jgi:oligoribonuclease NrnB/cAMP/cGMP phosphodiesterase (DHH superfamily)
MKNIVLYHDHCADGFGAAFAAWTVLGNDAEYIAMDYKNPVTDEFIEKLSGNMVYILDFSFSKEITNRIIICASSVVWLDHHKTAFEMWCGEDALTHDRYLHKAYVFNETNKAIMLDNNRSGALIAWEYFNPSKPAPALIRHIDDQDRWQFKIQGTKAVSAMLWSLTPWSFDQWSDLEDQITDPEGADEFIGSGESILRAHQQNCNAVVEKNKLPCVISTSIGDFNGLSANCNYHMASDVGSELAKLSCTFGLVWYVNNDGTVSGSLRSIGEFDVSAIAKALGGGGHRNAAGFSCTLQQLSSWISGIKT